ncbi:MAG: SulP family inorganic anion transporter [Micrococcales bacterium]
MRETLKFWVGNLNAGFTVALVALPLAIAFGESSSLGAAAGITSAIFAGMVAAVFGGSKFQVSGPTGAMTVVLIPLALKFGPTGVLFSGLLAGIILVLAGVLKLGRHIHRLPASVIEGFSAGIAVVIALQQFGWAFGVTGVHGDHVYETAWAQLIVWLGNPTIPALAMSLSVMLAVVFGLRLFPKLPVSVIVLSLSTLIASGFGLKLATIPQILNPLGSIRIDFLALTANFSDFLIPALGIASLGAFEALISAKIADKMVGPEASHDSDRELLGQGMANLLVPFLGGVPATAALARTAVNVRSGATSRVAAVAHSIFLALMVLALSPLVSLIPLPALAGVLLATAYNMVKTEELQKVATASKLDFILVVSCLLLTVFVDLTSALLIGVLTWLALRKTKLAQGETDLDV